MSAMHPNEAHPAAKTLRILIVGDSESDAQLLVRELQHFGYAPIWERTDNAAELQAAVTRRTWDVVLCDYRMPQFNELGALKTVRASAPDLPVILVSEAIGEEMAVAAMRAGADDYLLKDRLARLGAAVQRSLQEAEQRRARRRAEDQLQLLFHVVEQCPAAIASTGAAGDIEYVNPRITHFVQAAEDLTERKRIEESLRKVESQLRQAQKMEALGELAGGIAHDFNNFLGAIIVNAQLARAACAADATVAERLDCVIAASRQAAGLARQILTFSRRGEQQRRPVQLGPVVQEALRLLRPTLPAHIEVQVEIPSDGRTVLADATQVQEAVINLWMNACHACREASGRVVVSLADRDVDGSGQHPGLPAGPYVCLTVRDNGCGMPPEVQKRIFEPFFSTKTEGQGTGLGLTLVQRIMLAHQGAIAVESRAQEGTAFHLLFPEHPQEAAATGPPEPLPRRNGERRPLVDAPALFPDAVQGLVESLGSRDTACGPPLETPAAFCAHADEFKLAFTDLSLRKMNGAELASQLLAARPTIPIVPGSGCQLAGSAQPVRNLGVRDVLAKPVHRSQLAESVTRSLSQRETNA